MLRQILLFTLLLVQIGASAQISSVQTIINQADSLQAKMPREKIFIHLDRSAYTTGDTIWFKSYLLDASFLTPSRSSGILYLELSNDSGMVAHRLMVRSPLGLGSGMIVLNEKEIAAGSYTLRAYTNMMRNFGSEAFFRKDLYISAKAENTLFASAQSILVPGVKDSVRASIRFRRLDDTRIVTNSFLFRLTDGRRVYIRDEITTDSQGKIDFNFPLPAGADPGKLTILASVKTKGENKSEIAIPLSISRTDYADLQFMPESGHLVAGLPAKLGIKSIGENGIGINVKGEIFNSTNQKVVDFETTHKGMGSVDFLPLAGETYKAKITGTDKTWSLPEVKRSGTAMQIFNDTRKDSIDVIVMFSADMTIDSPYYLLGQYGSVAGFGAIVKGNSRIRVSKKLFPTGIVRFTLFNPQKKPLNERIVFVDHHNQLKISLKPGKVKYAVRDSVSLDLEVVSQNNKPIQGTFSIAVTDNNQVKPDDSLSANIYNNVFLSSDLKGNVEDPGYYFLNGSKTAKQLDDLMLTQGWIGYNWDDLMSGKAPSYEAESEQIIKGRVTNVFNKALKGTQVTLITTKPLLVMETSTDSLGRFIFNDFPAIDSGVFRLQANNRKGKSFNVGIEVPEFKAPEIPLNPYPTIPWYVNADSSLLNQVKTRIREERAELNLPAGVKMLQEVTVSAKKIIPGSKNLNGPGNSDFVLDENDLKKLGKKNLLQLLEEQVPGFFVKTFMKPHPPTRFNTINGFKLKIVMDGVQLDFLYNPIPCGDEKCTDDYLNFQRQYLEYYTAEDIIGFEVMEKGRFGNRYSAQYPDEDKQPETSKNPTKLKSGPPPPPAEAWLEITTRSGKGPFMRAMPGTYLYRAIPFASNRQFYRPRYHVKDAATLPDLRSTIHWEPHVITDRDGRAKISFYSADQKGSYTINVQGTNMDGEIGYGLYKIKVE